MGLYVLVHIVRPTRRSAFLALIVVIFVCDDNNVTANLELTANRQQYAYYLKEQKDKVTYILLYYCSIIIIIINN